MYEVQPALWARVVAVALVAGFVVAGCAAAVNAAVVLAN